jgi:hypothetical protein
MQDKETSMDGLFGILGIEHERRPFRSGRLGAR